MPYLKQWALGIAVVVFVLMGIGLYYQHSTIASQEAAIASKDKVIEGFQKDKDAQEKADKQLSADKDKIARERDTYKSKLDEALKNNPCANEPLDDDTKRLLKELYGSQGS